MKYQSYQHKVPELILNKAGEINLENKNILKIRFEVDYNSLTKEQLDDIIKDSRPQFNEASGCITFNGKNDYKMENLTYIPIEKEDGTKGYISVKTENNTINFKMIKKNIEVILDNEIIKTTDIDPVSYTHLTLPTT